ncbi:MAG TPA: pirin family protein [Anaeromyxobacteraceae bacterium]|nr:pirin family protein [Anaeromyxobacteraceae bacterium]
MVKSLFEGEGLHRDSLGTVQPIHPAELNWMTAGRGIVHSERMRRDARGRRRRRARHRRVVARRHVRSADRFSTLLRRREI